MAGLFKPPCARQVEGLPFEGDSGQHPVEGTLSVGGDEYHTISKIVSIPCLANEPLTLRKIRLNEAVSELLSYSIRVALWGVNCVLHLLLSPQGYGVRQFIRGLPPSRREPPISDPMLTPA